MKLQNSASSPQILPVILSHIGAKMCNIIRRWLKSKQFWRWLGNISMPNNWPFLPCIVNKMPGNIKFHHFHQVKVMPKLEKSTKHNKNLTNPVGGQNTPACQISDKSSNVFSGKCPGTSKNRGINAYSVIQVMIRWLIHLLDGWTDRTKDRCIAGWKDNPKNIMPPASKGGGIKCNKIQGICLYWCYVKACYLFNHSMYQHTGTEVDRLIFDSVCNMHALNDVLYSGYPDSFVRMAVNHKICLHFKFYIENQCKWIHSMEVSNKSSQWLPNTPFASISKCLVS